MGGDERATGRVGLSRDRILRTAVRIADEAGFESLSMRNLAARLGAAPMALYRHVANKDDLVDGMVDLVFAEVEVLEGAGWRVAMRERAVALRTALGRHPWAVGRIEARAPGPANLRHHHAVMASLREEAGLPVRPAIDAYHLMDSYIYGFALQEQSLPADLAAEAEARRAALTDSEPALAERFPYLIEVVEELGASGYDAATQFERGLDMILDGIEQMRDRRGGR